MKKLLLFASLAMAAAAFAVPSTASAIWTDNHAHIPAGTNPVVHLEGNFSYTSPIGGISCTQVTATTQITGGTTTWHLTQFTPTLASCKGTGGLGGCTVTGFTSKGFPWTGHAIGNIITQTGVLIHNTLSGLFCPATQTFETTATDDIVLQPVETGADGTGKHTTISSFHIGGGLTITDGAGNDLGTQTLSGTLTPTASDNERYGWT